MAKQHNIYSKIKSIVQNTGGGVYMRANNFYYTIF